LSDIRPDRRDKIEFEGAGDVFSNSCDGEGVAVAVAFSVDLEGTFDELCRRVKKGGDMRNEFRVTDLDSDSETIPVDT
jgi:hypothetical protein